MNIKARLNDLEDRLSAKKSNGELLPWLSVEDLEAKLEQTKSLPCPVETLGVKVDCSTTDNKPVCFGREGCPAAGTPASTEPLSDGPAANKETRYV